MNKSDPRKALGKGLSALLPGRAAPPAPAPESVPAPAPHVRDENILTVPIAQLHSNPAQPRREFDAQALAELSQSIAQDGIIQPIVVRRTAPDSYQIIAGERRWRAAKQAGLAEVPIVLRHADDQKVLELAIVENIQREDLNPIELALAFERMVAELSLSHEEIGEKTGKDRATVTNSIRLLQLPNDLRELVGARKLTPGHARALLKLPNERVQREMAERAIREGWSVRQIEEATKAPAEPGDEIVARPVKTARTLDPNVRAALEELERQLGTKVRIVPKSRGKGRIEIEYYSDEDLDRIYSLVMGRE